MLNPRYASYARAHGRLPVEQLAADKEEYPGGAMCGFILWMSTQLRLFAIAHPEGITPNQTVIDHDEWSAFLERAADAANPQQPEEN
jgi:hypothetical protein